MQAQQMALIFLRKLCVCCLLPVPAASRSSTFKAPTSCLLPQPSTQVPPLAGSLPYVHSHLVLHDSLRAEC